MSVSARDVSAILGPVDEALVADIVATEATPQELSEAWAWVNNNDTLMDEGRPLPAGRVAALVDLLAPQDDDELGSP